MLPYSRARKILVYDLKYHLTTIVAIFLALAVGIVVGSSLIAGSSVKGLEDQFGKLREENRQVRQATETLSDQIQQHTEFERSVAPVLVKSRLYGRNVAIIQTGDYVTATQSAMSILEQSGASIISVTTFTNLKTASAHKRMERAMRKISGEPIEPDQLQSVVLGIIAESVANGSNPDAMDILEHNGLLSTSGDYDKRVSRIVLVGGSARSLPKGTNILDLTLIDKLKALGISTLVGVEPLDVVSSYIPAYHTKQLATVDNVDQYMGQVALVYAVWGESGRFGVKRTSDRVVPESLSPSTRHW